MKGLLVVLVIGLVLVAVVPVEARHDEYACAAKAFSREAKFLSPVGWIRWLWFLGTADEGAPEWMPRWAAEQVWSYYCAP